MVLAVVYGGTIEVLHNTRAERIRLNGIDCPEKGQAYGKKAKQAASAPPAAHRGRRQEHMAYG